MIYVSGGTSGIGEAVAKMIGKTRNVIAFGKEGGATHYRVGLDPVVSGVWSTAADQHACTAVVSCAGSHDNAIDDCLGTTISMFELLLTACAGRMVPTQLPCVAVALSGGGIGGPPSLDLPGRYIAAKAGIASYVEWFALKYPNIQAFCVAPGRTATRLTNFDGASPAVPAAFICELLTGAHRHLSGSLLAAQRDTLLSTPPMKLRREAEGEAQETWRGDPC